MSPIAPTEPTALVTGATRGIGRETARQLAASGAHVVLTGRSYQACTAAADAIHNDNGGHVDALALDVTEASDIEALLARLPAVDILVNNAGIFPDQGMAFDDVDEATIRAELDVHLFGAWRLCRAYLPGMLERGHGRIVNLTSGYGCTGMDAGMPGYRLAKASVNALTQIVAAEVEGHGDIKINAVDPGWVRTDMGGDKAPRGVAEAAADVVWAATLPPDGPHGALLRYRESASW